MSSSTDTSAHWAVERTSSFDLADRTARSGRHHNAHSSFRRGTDRTRPETWTAGGLACLAHQLGIGQAARIGVSDTQE